MKIITLLLGLLLAFPTFAQSPDAEKARAEFKSLPWQRGPGPANVAGKGTLRLTDQDAFLDAAGTKRLLVLYGNPPSEGNYAVLPRTDEHWFGIFTFDDTGYVKDDEKIDADALLAKLKEGNAEDQAERQKLHLPVMTLTGWEVPPHYDSVTKRLEWGTRLENADGTVTVNYTARLLGRTGVMSAILVTAPETMEADRKSFSSRLDRFQFNSGEQYAEYRQGDRVAAFGLGALILGGAAAVATKKGLWAVIGGFLLATWKFLLAAFVAASAAVRRFWARKK